MSCLVTNSPLLPPQPTSPPLSRIALSFPPSPSLSLSRWQLANMLYLARNAAAWVPKPLAKERRRLEWERKESVELEELARTGRSCSLFFLGNRMNYRRPLCRTPPPVSLSPIPFLPVMYSLSPSHHTAHGSCSLCSHSHAHFLVEMVVCLALFF